MFNPFTRVKHKSHYPQVGAQVHNSSMTRITWHDGNLMHINVEPVSFFDYQVMNENLGTPLLCQAPSASENLFLNLFKLNVRKNHAS